MVLLTRLAQEVFRRSTDEVLGGISLKQYVLLRHLRGHQGTCAQQALCGSLHLDPNYVVLLLNDSEEAGLLERRRDPNDRRRHIVELTDEGGRALERAAEGMQAVEDEVLSGLSQKERVELGRMLEKALAKAESNGSG
jgi:DNA-binding MarR family transcriptional regulator